MKNGGLQTWLVFDEIRVVPGVGASVAGRVLIDLPLFASHFPLRPVVPGVLLVAGLGEVAARYLSETTGGQFRLQALEAAKFRRYVGPDADVRLEVAARGARAFSATVTAGGAPAVTVRTLTMSPARGVS